MKYSINGHRSSLLASFLLPSLLCLGCGGPAPLTVDMPLHLEEHLDVATIVGSAVPEDVPPVVEWRFDEPQPDWKPAPRGDPSAQRAKVSWTVDALRMIVRAPPGDSDELCSEKPPSRLILSSLAARVLSK